MKNLTRELQFLPIHLDRDWELCLKFRLDSYICSFGSSESFYREGGESHYREWLGQKIKSNPSSAVHIHWHQQIIGQMELGKLKAEPAIGLVNLYYLAPDFRGRGFSEFLDRYAVQFLKDQGHQVARLNVSPTNLRALRYYTKNGWVHLGPNPHYPQVHIMEKNL